MLKFIRILFISIFAVSSLKVYAKLDEEDLAKIATIVNTAISQSEKRIQFQLESRLVASETRLESRLDSLESRLVASETRLEFRLDALESRLVASETRLESRLDSLESRLVASETRLESRLDSLESRLVASEKRLMGYITSGFTSLHNFGRDRMSVLQSSSIKITYPCNVNSTGHILYFRGKVFMVFTPHVECKKMIAFKDQYILHSKYDVGLFVDWELKEEVMALNVTDFASPELGDQIVAFGFGETAKGWLGAIVGAHEKDCNEAQHWSSQARMCQKEYIVQADQHSGQWGGPVANGCGYLGMAHIAIVTNGTMATFAGIITASIILDLAIANFDKLPSLSDYPEIRVVNIPKMPFVDCHHQQEQEVYVSAHD
jgi:hypothetical protein